MNKENSIKLYDRLDEALQDMYHNATLHFPFDLDLTDNDWQNVNDNAGFAIEDMNSKFFDDDKHWQKQIKLGFTHNERFFWLVSRITDHGKLYTYGRGGRTLAPSKLIRSKGGSSFAIRDSSDLELTRSEATDMIQVIEAFNQYVNNWCKADNLRDMILQSREYDQEAA